MLFVHMKMEVYSERLVMITVVGLFFARLVEQTIKQSVTQHLFGQEEPNESPADGKFCKSVLKKGACSEIFGNCVFVKGA